MYVSLKVSFLEDLNYIINAGKISNMFENEELDSIVMRVGTFAEQLTCIEDRKYLLSLFQRVLFCVLILSSCHVSAKGGVGEEGEGESPHPARAPMLWSGRLGRSA